MTVRKFVHPLDAHLSCVGSGLVTLDIIVDSEYPDRCIARSGGSCGNVMAILAYFGWKAYPITRLGEDQAARMVLDDFANFGVDTTYVSRDPAVNTPAIIEGVRNSSKGSRTHSYSLRCPYCGNYLLRYKTIPQKLTERVVKDLGQAQVFYFDRLSKGILRLAKHYREQGALVVFEPSGIKDERLFRVAAELTHILKYSRERLSDVSSILGDYVVPLEIQTLGRGGLQYRRRLGNELSMWQHLPAFRLSDAVDEAGAGDWCTAGIIHSIGRYGAASFWRTRNRGVTKALELGQAMAAVNCCFKSAKGAMYSLSLMDLNASVVELTKGQVLSSTNETTVDGILSELLLSICARCSQGA